MQFCDNPSEFAEQNILQLASFKKLLSGFPDFLYIIIFLVTGSIPLFFLMKKRN